MFAPNDYILGFRLRWRDPRSWQLPPKLDLDFTDEDKLDIMSTFLGRLDQQIEDQESTARCSEINPSEYYNLSDMDQYFRDPVTGKYYLTEGHWLRCPYRLAEISKPYKR